MTRTELGPPLPIHGANQSERDNFNMNRVLLANIQRNDYFKALAKFRTVGEIIDEVSLPADSFDDFLCVCVCFLFEVFAAAVAV